jgi:hydrogenase expression/formation protein HypC
MRVVSAEGAEAWCEGRGQRLRLNMLPVGPQPAGTWIMAYLNSARDVITEEQAAQVNDALDALEAALRGDTSNLDAFFPDLANREPELPAHLKQAKG